MADPPRLPDMERVGKAFRGFRLTDWTLLGHAHAGHKLEVPSHRRPKGGDGRPRHLDAGGNNSVRHSLQRLK